MGSGIKGVAFAAAGFMFLAQGAYAWYGPICYSDRTTQLVLTIPSISGETPGDLKVDFDDNDGKARLGLVRASQSVKNAHEVVLVRDAESLNGVFAVVVTSPRSTTGYKFELEFRKDASECAGAIIKATDRTGGGLLARQTPVAVPASNSSAGVTLASAPVRPRPVRAPKPRSAVPALAVGNGSTPVQVVSFDSGEVKPLPTPSAGSEAPVAQEPPVQQAGEAPRAEPVEVRTIDVSSDAPKSEPAVQSSETGSAVPAASDSSATGN